jgi:hypothetical protein
MRSLAPAAVMLAVCSARAFCASAEYESFAVGNIPEENILEMRDHNDALYHWMNAYLLGKIPGGLTVVHVDTHPDDGCSCINTFEKAKAMLARFGSMPQDGREDYFDSAFKKDGKVDIDGFIVPAMYMGIIDRFVWVRPNFHSFVKDGPWRKQRFFYYMLESAQLNDSGYCSDIIDCSFGDSYGIDSFEVEDLPASSAPVLLDIDMDTFGDYDTERLGKMSFSRVEIELMMDELLMILNRQAPQVYMVTIADSPNKYSTTQALEKKPYLKNRLSSPK